MTEDIKQLRGGVVSKTEPGSKPLRGGSWYDLPWDCRSASRISCRPDERYYFFGFRVVCKKESAPNSQITEKVNQ